MIKPTTAVKILALSMVVAPLLQGCVAVVGAGAAGGASVYHDRRSAGTYIDDEVIELKVIDAISRDKSLWEQSHINATSFNNIVLLTGEAPSQKSRSQVLELTRAIPKVRQVHNEIAVAAPSSILSRSGDTWITGKVKAALLQADNVEGTRVKVVTENGVVYLMGLLTPREATAATDVARRVRGVQRVVKLLEHLK